jgi:hypothetical protein
MPTRFTAISIRGRKREWREEPPVEDQSVIDQINRIASEEHELFEKESRGEVTSAERDRLRRLEVTLDQCWDLLRQRRARRAAGLDPEGARVRDEGTVEGYMG